MIQQAQQVNDIIDHLAAKLSVPVGHLWAVLTQQSRVEALTSWAWAAIWLVLACVVSVAAWRLRSMLDAEDAAYAQKKAEWQASKENSYWTLREPETDEPRFWLYFARVVICAALLIIAAGQAIGGMRYQVNPEYYALQQVLATISR